MVLPCSGCGCWFPAKRANRRYCCLACRRAAEYRRRRAAQLDAEGRALVEAIRRDRRAGLDTRVLEQRLLRCHMLIEQLRQPPEIDGPDDDDES